MKMQSRSRQARLEESKLVTDRAVFGRGLFFSARRSIVLAGHQIFSMETRRKSHGEEATHASVLVCARLSAVDDSVRARHHGQREARKGRPLGGSCRKKQPRQVYNHRAEVGIG